MTRFSQRWSLVAIVIGALILAGCSSKERQARAPAPPAETETLAPLGEAEHVDSAAAVVPAGTVGEIWAQIGNEQDQLVAVIQNDQLDDVHRLAFGIRDLVVGMAAKANAASPSNARKVNSLVAQVKTSAAKLDELGDAGNLSGTQEEYAKFDTALRALNTLTAGI